MLGCAWFVSQEKDDVADEVWIWSGVLLTVGVRSDGGVVVVVVLGSAVCKGDVVSRYRWRVVESSNDAIDH